MATKSKTVKIVIGPCRLSFVALKEPRSFEGQDPKYRVCLLIPKDDPSIAKAEAAINEVYQDSKVSILGGLPLNSPKLKYPLRDGEEWIADHPGATEFEDVMFINASNKNQPGMFDEDRNPIFDAEELYSGVWAYASITCFAFNQGGGKGMAFFLNSLMKHKDDEKLGGGFGDVSDFDEVGGAPTAPQRTPARSAAPQRGSASTAPQRTSAPARVTYDDVMAAAKVYVESFGREAFVDVLNVFDVASAKDLKPAQYAEFLGAIGDGNTSGGGEDDLF